MINTKYLIIGNSAAAIGGITGIRKVDAEGCILVVSDEKYHTYSRPLISYWLEGRVEESKMLYREPDFYDKNNCDVMLGVKAESIDKVENTVTLSDGAVIHYEKLLLATGSTPFVPPIAGRDKAKNAFTFTTMADAKGVREVLTPKSKVVILGAGLIGLKAAEAMVNQCESLTIVDLADRVLLSVLDAEGAAVFEKHLEGQGMTLKLKTSIKEIGEGTVTLSDDSVLPYDVLILAVGTRPEVTLAESAGAQVAKGILTDKKQKTSLFDVFAAGDCTVSHDITSDCDKNMAILPNAYRQGEVAGINMAGGEALYEKAFPANAMGLLGLYMLTAGSYDGEAVVTYEGQTLKKFYVKDNVLKGYILIGSCERAGIYTDLIREQVDLTTVDAAALFEEPRLMAFDKAARFAKVSTAH